MGKGNCDGELGACPQCTRECRKQGHGRGMSVRTCGPSFIKLVSANTTSFMEIPMAFSREYLLDVTAVVLEGPSGRLWHTLISGGPKTGTSVVGFGAKGWKSFASDHFIKAGDTLAFMLASRDHFVVQIFDGNGLEKTFPDDYKRKRAKNAVALEIMNEKKPKEEEDEEEGEKENGDTDVPESCKELAEIAGGVNGLNSDGHPISARKKRGATTKGREVRGQDGVCLSISSKKKKPRVEVNERQWGHKTPSPSPSPSTSPTKLQRSLKEFFTCSVKPSVSYKDSKDLSLALWKPVEPSEMLPLQCTPLQALSPNRTCEIQRQGVPESVERSGGKTYVAEVYISQRPPVSQEERDKAMEAAKAFRSSKPSVRKLMLPSQVYRGFWLNFPLQFARNYLPQDIQSVILQDASGAEWTAKWLGRRGGLSGGWRKFALDHHLEEGDVCVFEIVNRRRIQMRVHIFRVLDLTVNGKGHLRIPQKSSCRTKLVKRLRKTLSPPSSSLSSSTSLLSLALSSSSRKKRMRGALILGYDGANNTSGEDVREEVERATMFPQLNPIEELRMLMPVSPVLADRKFASKLLLPSAEPSPNYTKNSSNLVAITETTKNDMVTPPNVVVKQEREESMEVPSILTPHVTKEIKCMGSVLKTKVLPGIGASFHNKPMLSIKQEPGCDNENKTEHSLPVMSRTTKLFGHLLI